MLTVNAERIGELAVVECKGRMVRSEDVFKLRETVLAQGSASVIALDLSEIKAIGGGAAGMLAFLANWASQRQIQFSLYSPSKPVVDVLTSSGAITGLPIATFQEMMGILMHCEGEHHAAAA